MNMSVFYRSKNDLSCMLTSSLCDFLVTCRFVSILFAITSFFSLCGFALKYSYMRKESENIRNMERLRLERGKNLAQGLWDPPKRYRG